MNQQTNPQLNYMPQQHPQYNPQTQLLQAVDWLISNPTIPLALKKQFFVMWENIVFGNYEQRDILFLMSKFREWSILVKWYIPEQQWGNVHSFESDEEDGLNLEMDLSTLLNMLEQLYFIQLTRGKEGFTTKELTTYRNIIKGESEQQKKKKGIRLF